MYIAITGVVALVLYFLVYAAIEFAYHRIYAKFDKYPKIEGVWYHVHIPKHFESGGEDYQHTKLSVGRTEICREWSVFTFEGENDRCTVSNGQLVFLNEAKTEWRTKATELSPETDTEIIEVYGAETGTVQNHTVDVCPCCKTAFKKPVSIPEAGQNRFGVHRLKLKADGHMEGSYSDCYPSLKSGTVYFYRTKEERNARVRQYFAIAEKLRAQNGDGQQ